MDKIHIQFTFFSAFYSPLISTMSGGFLEKEGLDADWSVLQPGVPGTKALEDGTAQVIQSAPISTLLPLEKGDTPVAVHFAQINELDGFFITGREADPEFKWEKLEGAEVVSFAAGQPNAMLRYACDKAGIDFDKIKLITPGGAGDIDKAFRDGQGQYVHQQGPYPQQLEKDGVGHLLAQVGPQIGPNAFSTVAATRQWLGTEQAKAFMRAYKKARLYINETPAAEIAKAEKSYFPNIDEDVLADCIATYQRLGCWTPRVEITKPAYDVYLEVFQSAGTITKNHLYEQVCMNPPETE